MGSALSVMRLGTEKESEGPPPPSCHTWVPLREGMGGGGGNLSPTAVVLSLESGSFCCAWSSLLPSIGYRGPDTRRHSSLYRTQTRACSLGPNPTEIGPFWREEVHKGWPAGAGLNPQVRDSCMHVHVQTSWACRMALPLPCGGPGPCRGSQP